MIKKISILFTLLTLTISIFASGEKAGKFDSYKLAITWSPGFCADNLEKQECKLLDNQLKKDFNYAVTLHGLWPNVDGTITYGYCTEPKFNSYESRAFNSILLDYYQPAAKYCENNTFCLPQHEWDKHGICQLKWDQPEFFYIQAKMIDIFRDILVMPLKNKHSIKNQKLRKLISKKIPSQGRNTIDLVCNSKTGILEEIRVKLDKGIEKISSNQWRNLSIKDLSKYISESSSVTNNCGKNIILRR